jgi:hypothetical protein
MQLLITEVSLLSSLVPRAADYLPLLVIAEITEKKPNRQFFLGACLNGNVRLTHARFLRDALRKRLALCFFPSISAFKR